MRLLNRPNQYQRLWPPPSGEPQSVIVGELAERCFCGERHVYTLLKQAQDAGWLEWHAQSERGKRGQLRFLMMPDSLRNNTMGQALQKGEQLSVLELAQPAPGELRTLLQSFMGGQWQNDTPTLRISYYRPLDLSHPGFLLGRAEQHLAEQAFPGLTRFDSTTQRPCGDLAHHWNISADGLRRDLYICSTLYWHNDDAVSSTQLYQQLLKLLELPALNKLFISVGRIEMTHPQCLTFTLHRSDYWLAHRLASYSSHLAHPEHSFVSTGPFRLTLLTPELVRIESRDHYHLSYPLLKTIEYWVTPQSFSQDLGISCRHPVQIAIGKPKKLPMLSQVNSGISLGSCYLTLRKSARLNTQQARRLINIIHRSFPLQTLEVDENLITSSNTPLPGWTIPQWDEFGKVALPEKLMLAYHLSVKPYAMVEQLRQVLVLLGCELTLIFHNAKNWDGVYPLAQADLTVGDRLIGEAPEYILE